MAHSRLLGRQWLSVMILLTLAVVAVSCMWKMATDHECFGKGDFLAYWSATRLLLEGRNPYDPAAMLLTERQFTHSTFDAPITADNPASLFVLMLPLALLPFTEARATWLIVNLILLLVASCLLARTYGRSTRKTLLVLGLYWAAFPQVLVGLLAGQVISLVLLGLAGSTFLVQKGKWFWAGASLIATTVKPHMAVLAVPYLLLYMAHRRKWQGWLGLAAAGAVVSLVLTALRADWPSDLMGFLPRAPVWHWATPTIGGLMSGLRMGEFWRCLVVGFLPLTWQLARRHANIQPQAAVALLTVITVPTTFFGWSYDQTVLLIPIAQIIGWLMTPARAATRALVSVSVLILIAANWVQRMMVTNEMYYLWIPVVVAILYGIYRLECRESQSEPSAELRLSYCESPSPA